MLQNGSTNHNSLLDNKTWWGIAPNIATEKVVEPEVGLGSSMWAGSHGGPAPAVLATSKTSMALPTQGSLKLGREVTDVNSDLEMDHGFSFTIPPSYASKISGFSPSIAQSNYKSWRGLPPHHQSATHDHLPNTPMNFSSEVAMVDDDGDVIMMDLNDPDTIIMVDQVARDERQAETTSEYADSRPGLRPSVSSPRISNPSCVLVIDTSFILSHLQLVDNLVRSHLRWRNVIVMPWATIQELDGLKNSRRQNNGIDVSKLARDAINWAYGAFGKRDPGVWGQIKEEKYDNDAIRGDPAILDCCRFFHRIQGHNTVLLTHDKNLGVQAMMNSIGIVQMNGSKTTAESILSQLGLNPVNIQIAPVLNNQSPIPPPTQHVPVKSVSRPADTSRQEVQPPFYPTADVDSPYLQYGTKRMNITPPKASAGLYDSIYAYGNKTAIPKFEAVKGSFNQPASSFFRTTNTQNTLRKTNAEIKTELNGFLQEVSRELITNLVPLLKKCTLDKLGDVDTLWHLNIIPENQVHGIIDIERFFHTHWTTVFTEVFPKNLQQVFSKGDLNQRYTRWVHWAAFSGPDAVGPSKIEIRRWIEEWDLIWKRLIYTERETVANMDTVEKWRTALVKVGLFD